MQAQLSHRTCRDQTLAFMPCVPVIWLAQTRSVTAATSPPSCTGAAEPVHAVNMQHAAAQHWQHRNDMHHHGSTAYMNGHSGWAAQQNGGMHGGSNGVVWHEGRALQMPPPGGWDASNHPLSKPRTQTRTVMLFIGIADVPLCYLLVLSAQTF